MLSLCVALGMLCMSLDLRVPICEEGPAVPTLLSSWAAQWLVRANAFAGWNAMGVGWADVDGVGCLEGCSGQGFLVQLKASAYLVVCSELDVFLWPRCKLPGNREGRFSP